MTRIVTSNAIRRAVISGLQMRRLQKQLDQAQSMHTQAYWEGWDEFLASGGTGMTQYARLLQQDEIRYHNEVTYDDARLGRDNVLKEPHPYAGWEVVRGSEYPFHVRRFLPDGEVEEVRGDHP